MSKVVEEEACIFSKVSSSANLNDYFHNTRRPLDNSGVEEQQQAFLGWCCSTFTEKGNAIDMSLIAS